MEMNYSKERQEGFYSYLDNRSESVNPYPLFTHSSKHNDFSVGEDDGIQFIILAEGYGLDIRPQIVQITKGKKKPSLKMTSDKKPLNCQGISIPDSQMMIGRTDIQ